MGRRLAKLTGEIESRLWPRSPVILMYHRVAEPQHDLWGLAVGPDLFAEQIQALSEIRRIVPLGELLRLARDGPARERPLAAITFDDGYHDAYTAAQPILQRLDCPATVFVATGLVGSSREFWWDELAQIILLTPSLPQSLTLEFSGRTRTWRTPAPDAQARERLCRQLRRRMRDMAPVAIDQQLEALRLWAGVTRSQRDDHRLMTGEEVGRLSDGLITVGAHTVGHPSLPRLSARDQAAEIQQSRLVCEDLIGAPVEHFAYPFGHYDGSSVRAVRDAGFVSACATTPGVVRPWTDLHRLPRISPGRRSGEDLLRWLGR